MPWFSYSFVRSISSSISSFENMSILDTGIRNVRNVLRYTIGAGSAAELPNLLASSGRRDLGPVIYFVDEFFKAHSQLLNQLEVRDTDELVFVSAKDEPTTDYIDQLVAHLFNKNIVTPGAVVGMGGGVTMDVAKAVSNLMTNGGRAEAYQGWDLVKVPGTYKIAVPTISGTGAEATRTCVLTNKRTGLKLGMNSDFTVFDQIIMDPALTATVPRDQYFHTGMDAYIHCVEALAGSYRNAIGDAYSRETINLCRQVFLEGDMQTPANREKLMVASYLGGCAIATSYVGLVHPLSAGLSVVLGVHHCVGNCIVMRAMADYYPVAHDEFWKMVERQRIRIPEGICRNLDEAHFQALYDASMMHQKPLTNALGDNFKSILTLEKVTDLFKKM